MTNETPPQMAVTVEQALQKGLELAVLTLAFHGRDRGTDRQEAMLDGLEELARQTDPIIRAAQKALTQQSAATGGEVPSGWALVPCDPTEAMCSAAAFGLRNLINSVPFEKREGRWGKPRKKLGYCIPHNEKHRARYKAMLAAAPKPTHPNDMAREN